MVSWHGRKMFRGTPGTVLKTHFGKKPAMTLRKRGEEGKRPKKEAGGKGNMGGTIRMNAAKIKKKEHQGNRTSIEKRAKKIN